MAELVKMRMDGRVAIVTLDHPPVNALSQQLLEELEAMYDELDRGDEARAIVLGGEGEKAFVAGADITEFPALREQVEEAASEGGSARGTAFSTRPHSYAWAPEIGSPVRFR
jgi:enoyl-CoA hydratase